MSAIATTQTQLQRRCVTYRSPLVHGTSVSNRWQFRRLIKFVSLNSHDNSGNAHTHAYTSHLT